MYGVRCAVWLDIRHCISTIAEIEVLDVSIIVSRGWCNLVSHGGRRVASRAVDIATTYSVEGLGEVKYHFAWLAGGQTHNA